MDTRKSQGDMEIYVDLCVHLLRADPIGSIRRVNLERDIATVKSRSSNEGLSFLTKTLPKLGKSLDMALESGRLEIPREFSHSHRYPNNPAFMQEYFSRVFTEDGVLQAEPSADAIKHLRQVLYLCYKLELPYTQAQEEAVIDNFILTEEELKLGEVISDGVIDFDHVSRITSSIFKDFDPKKIVPRHGPGAVATGERLEKKWEFSRLFSGIHSFYPYYEYFMVGMGRELLDRLSWYKSLVRTDKGRAKVVLVPKDSRGPRLISCEPLEYQWIQQGLGRKLMEHFERNSFTRGNINFTYQEINQRLALESSKTQEFATIDLKDASDRVSMYLVRQVFSQTPELLRALEATRSHETLLPDGRVVTLSKYAPMGSALCFPVESYVFWVVCVSAVIRATGMSLRQAGKLVYVYGDDIIVPTRLADVCINALEHANLKVNLNKTLVRGSFRESCGVDAYKGVNITPTRIRTLWSGKRSDGSAYASYVSLMNHLHEKGYEAASAYVLTRLQQTYGTIPWGTETSGYPCRRIPDPSLAEERNSLLFKKRWNRDLQRWEYNVRYLSVGKIPSVLDDWLRLLRDLVMPSTYDPQTVVIPRSTKIKRGWMSV